MLGALDKCGNYTIVSDAIRNKHYKCIGCNNRVILKSGEIRKPHFCHYTQSSCTYYDCPNESQIHKDLKYKIAQRLKNKEVFQFLLLCNAGTCGGEIRMDDIVYKDGDEIIVEYKQPDFIADVAVLNNGEIRYIIEIKHTHSTTTNVRPEPWYEISTEQENTLEYSDYYFCERKDRICFRCEIQKEPWVNNLPHRNNGNCLGCNKFDLTNSRNGIYIEPYCRQICRDCWNWSMPDEWFLELKEQYKTRIRCELEF